MKTAWVLPGGVDRSGTHRVIPAVLWLLERLARVSELHVFALHQGRRRERYDLRGATVHVIGPRPRRLRALFRIVEEHRRSPFDLVYGTGGMKSEVVASLAGRFLARPAVVHLTGGELADLPAIRYGGLASVRGRAWMRLALSGATRIVALSGPVVDLAARFGYHAERIPFGVDREEWPPRVPRRRDPRTVVRIVHVASINRVKDHPTLLRMLAILRDRGVRFRADIVGEDTLGGEMQALARELDLCDRVTFRGFLPNRDVRRLVEEAHLHVVSSLHEAGPVALLEAALAGVPTVGTSVGYVREWAPKGAVAVPPGDAEALALATEELVENEPRRLEVARRAQRRALEEDADRTAARLRSTWEGLIREGPDLRSRAPERRP